MFANMSRRFVTTYCKEWQVHLKITFVNILVLLFTVSSLDYSFAARPCRRSADGAQGFCLPLSECPDIRSDGASKPSKPDLCEPLRQLPLVCCVPKKPLKPDQQVQALSLSSSILEKTSQTESISRRKCREYAQLIENNDRDSLFETVGCITPRDKVGPALFGEFPHMVAYGVEELDGINFLCGGSLISERYVLTAGHCVEGSARYRRSKWVLLGSRYLFKDRNRPDSDPQVIKVSQTFTHPDYKGKGHYYFDVGLLQLASNVRFGRYVRPACLPSSRSTSSLELIMSGWGGAGTGKANDVLQKVTVHEAPYEVCNRSYGLEYIFELGVHNTSTMCVGLPGSSADACRGDSGGPLQAVSPDFSCMYEIIGVIALGRECGKGFTTACSRVEYYVSWIEDVVWG